MKILLLIFLSLNFLKISFCAPSLETQSLSRQKRFSNIFLPAFYWREKTRLEAKRLQSIRGGTKQKKFVKVVATDLTGVNYIIRDPSFRLSDFLENFV